MLFQFSFLNATHHLVDRQITTKVAVASLSSFLGSPRYATNRAVSRNGTVTLPVVASCSRGILYFPVKRKLICSQKRFSSFAGFDPITGNTNDVTTDPSDGESSSDSLIINMLRFEKQFRTMSKQQAIIELNSLLNVWYKNFTSRGFGYRPTTRPKSVVEMVEWVDSLRPDLEPTISTYQTLLDGFLSRYEDMRVAENILDRMLEILLKERREEMSSKTYKDLPINDSLEATSVMYSFHKVMQKYCERDNQHTAEKMLRKLEKCCFENNVPILSSDTYSVVITGFAKHGMPREADYILQSMLNVKDKLMRSTGRKILPTREMFDCCLNAWVAYPTKNSGERAELLVLKMNELSELGRDTKPSYKSYSKIVHAWVNSRNNYASERVNKIMETMERMDWSDEVYNPHLSEQVAQTYHAAMKLCSYRERSTDSVQKCLDYFARLDKVMGLQNVDHVTVQLLYSALIYTYAQSEMPETEARVQEIFTKVELLHKKYVETKIALNDGVQYDPYLSMYFYRALLHVFAKTGSGHKAETLLKRMMHEYLLVIDKEPSDVDNIRKIDTSCFNSVLLAWSRSTEPDAAHHAEKLFRQMFQSQNSKHMDVRVDTVSYNALLSAMAESTNIEVARRGDAYFRQILESNQRKCRATAVTYTKAILLWSNIGTTEALKRADELLDDMKTLKANDVKPTRSTYVAFRKVLRRCKDTLPPEEYLDRIQEIDRVLKKLK